MMTRFIRPGEVLTAALGALLLSASAGAQDTPPRTAPAVFPVDRIVAMVGPTPILASELEIAMSEWQQLGRPLPPDSNAARLEVLNDLISIEVLLQKAKDFNITVADEEISGEVDSRIRQIREQRFNNNEAEFRRALTSSGFESPEAFRAAQLDAFRKQRLQQIAIDSLRARGRFPQVHVPESEVRTAFEDYVRSRPDEGPGITFRQIIVRVEASDAEKQRSRALADSLLAALRAGASFDSLARAFSADSGSAVRGGDLGWFRRGDMAAPFDSAAFRLGVGQLSGVVRSDHGLHIIRVDRLRPGEVSARHILIREERDSSDVARARELVSRIATELRAGASYDSLAAIHHDPLEDRVVPDPYPIDSLPPQYKERIASLGVNEVSEPIDLMGQRGGIDKVGIVQVLTKSETSAPSYDRMRDQLLSRIREARSMERLMAQLRSEMYVDVRLDKVAGISR